MGDDDTSSEYTSSESDEPEEEAVKGQFEEASAEAGSKEQQQHGQQRTNAPLPEQQASAEHKCRKCAPPVRTVDEKGLILTDKNKLEDNHLFGLSNNQAVHERTHQDVLDTESRTTDHEGERFRVLFVRITTI